MRRTMMNAVHTILSRMGFESPPPQQNQHIEEARTAVHENRIAREELVKAFIDDDLFVKTLLEAHPRHE